MFESDASMEQIMESMRLVAEASLSPNPVKDIVDSSELAEVMWQEFADIHLPIRNLRVNSICYQVIRGMWMIAYGSAELLPVESIHLSYLVPHHLMMQVLERTTVDDLRMIFDYPGGTEALVKRVTEKVIPDHITMWGDHDADLVHELLAKFLSLNPSRGNFEEQVEAWCEEVEGRLLEPAASSLLSIANMLAVFYRNRGHSALDNPISTGSAESRTLDLAELVRLYDVIRESFYAVSDQGKKAPVKTIASMSLPLLVALSEVREDVSMFGMLEQETVLFANMDTAAKAKAMAYLSNERIAAILKEFGRMLGFGGKLAAHDLVRTDDHAESGRIEDLNINGFMTLANDVDQFYARYATNNLQTYGQDCEKSKAGPFIVIRDISGSMRGQKDIWSCALILRMAEQAFRDNRPFSLIIFARHEDSLKCVVIRPPKGADELMELICIIPHGGTNYEMALRQGIVVAETHLEFLGTDMLLITDGEAVVSPKFLRDFRIRTRDLDLRTHGLLINLGGGTVAPASLRTFCDTVKMASELTDTLAEEILTLV